MSAKPGQSQSEGELEAASPHLKIYLRVVSAGDVAIGPGKADLMAAIQAYGSLSKAGRALGISYRRVWDMVEAINKGFDKPLVTTSHGGAKGGGARLTETGEIVLALYRNMQSDVSETAEAHFDEIRKYLKTDT
ncbi:winged helix-turn-helix domain-containing protein [Asticcacaulis sp. BYS171W]|uniref:Winged helix-turn-helix domain-containing protein n=1 Tax=Asticcacaulis aquaticus TaxID=2984212 RepID=A0ABT5HWI6_9CAUL|nr:winged helix-turn-helix domain-containing protein [Asticcacaulis aquaticus]MDC7684452.1 winged helix-turn-helix domain-containing protein [Asticcacaulis aquaticus]